MSAVGLATCVACTSFGPTTVPGDQFDYNAAIARSTEQQLLLNLVRLRYSETPVFLKVSSVISQYSRVAGVSAGAGANTGVLGDNTATLGGSFVWADRPTITYSPLSGKEFAQNLLTPIPPRELFGLIQAGWPADLVLRVSVWSINDLDNEVARPSHRRQADDTLEKFFAVWRRLGGAGVLDLRKATGEQGNDGVVMFLRNELPADETPTEARRAELDSDYRLFRKLLGLNPNAREFLMRYGRVPENPDEVAVLTGSIWDIMLNLAWQFDVPQEHIESGRTGSTFQPQDPLTSPRIRVRFSEEEPEDTYVAVRAHGYWFYIDQNDSRSKRTFSFLQLLLNLSETVLPDNSPVITISN